MFTDTVGSTAAAQRNEAEALRLREEQARLVRPLFTAHQGHEVKSMGDGFLVEFDSALRAVQCATEIQQRLGERNARAGTTAIQVRIGIHLGDVEQTENDIFGDAVNIASRIEPLATPGGICISGEVMSQVRNKIPNHLEKLPATPLKGVQTPIDVFRVEMPRGSREPSSGSPARTGIAVLPFSNISPDPKDEYFADGLTEELITVLSKVRGLRVIARTSVSPYRSSSKGISQIGAELRVSSILEGSVRKAGSKLRITAQLIDVDTEGHLWAETYDRDLDDVFAVQSDVARQVAGALKVEVPGMTGSRSAAPPTRNPESYLAYLKGRTLTHHPESGSEGPRYLDKAIDQFTRAVELDGQNAAAYAGLSEATFERGLFYGESRRPVWIESAREFAARAVELDPDCAEGHSSLAITLYDDNQYVAAEKEFLTALSLNPNDARVRYHYADLLLEEARPADAERELALAEELDPLSTPILQKSFLLFIIKRQFDAARSRIDRMEKLGTPKTYVHFLRNFYSWAKSDDRAQLEQLELSLKADPANNYGQLMKAWTFAGVGQQEQARELLPSIEAMPPTVDKFRYLTETYAKLHDMDGLFRIIEQAVEAHEFDPIMFRLDPAYEHVRLDPRFQKVLERMNLA